MKRLLNRSWDWSFRQMPQAMVQRLAGEMLCAPCYHMVTDEQPPHVANLYRSRGIAGFGAELDYLLRRYRPVSLGELQDAIENARGLPRRAFFLSFDDGFREMSEIVAPLCRAKGVPATFFLTTGFLDNRLLGYRHKASLAIGRCLALGRERTSQLLAGWAAKRGLAPERLADPRRLFGAVRYDERHLLDEAAEALEIDFQEYLGTQRPYLTGDQVAQLLRQGFSIGGHSVDHPLYASLAVGEQIEQTRACMEELAARFRPAQRAFAFPFVSDGVPEEFYAEVFGRGIADLVFCIGAMPAAQGHRAVQRFGVESAEDLPLDRLIRREVSSYVKGRVWAGVKGK